MAEHEKESAPAVEEQGRRRIKQGIIFRGQLEGLARHLEIGPKLQRPPTAES